ncbi:oligosaccharide flippase family protein, partial [Vibrio splendidus]|uniref:oligosaccharide flippase family protein n=1 Tax=Vibrio splendidus TaxID=29497 RepID=UPI003D13D429
SMNYLILYSLSWFLVGVYVFTRIFKFDINYKSLGFYRLPYMEVIFIFGVMLLSSIFGKFDLLVIGNVLDANEYGYFSAAYKLVTIMLTIVTSISIVVLPFFSKEVNNLSSSNNFLMNMILYVSLFIFSFLISYSEPIIFIVFGSDYSESIEYLQYLGILLLLVPFYNSVIYQVLIPRKDYKSIFIIFFVSILAALSVFASGDEISNNMVFYIVSCNLFLFLFFAIKSYMFGFKVIIKRELIFCILCFFGMSFLSDNLSIEEMTQFYLGVGVYSILFLLFSYSIFRRNR